jgi:type III restriction enzyme
VVEKVAKASNIRRLIRLSRFLAQDKIESGAYTAQRAYVVSLLEKERKRVKDTKAFKAAVAEAGKISVRVVNVAYAGEVANGAGDPAGNGATTTALTVAQQNVEDIYDTAGRQLGEGLHADYVKARVAADASLTLSQAKVELYALLSDDKTLVSVEEACGKRFTQLHTKYQTKINALGDSRQQAYRKLLKMAKQPQQTSLTLPQRILVDGKEKIWPKHLLVDDKGNFPARLNPWEVEVLNDALAPKAAVAWLRNIPRQEWSFTVPYSHRSETKPHYPDFLIFRKSGSGFVADVLEPHSLSFDDGYAKARGLAEYAKQHGNLFGKIELIAKIKGKMRRLNLNDQTTRDKVLVVSNNEQLAQLFES